MTLATTPTPTAADEPMPWDRPTDKPPSIHLRLSLNINRDTPLAVHQVDTTPPCGALLIEGEGAVTIFFGFTDADEIAIAERLIAALQTVRDQAQARIDATVPVPA